MPLVRPSELTRVPTIVAWTRSVCRAAALARAQHQHAAAFGAHIAVGLGRKGLAQADARQHRGLGEVHELERRGQDADAAHDRGLDAAALQGLHGGIERHERGRAGGVDREARAVEVVDVGDPVGQDRGGVAGGEIAVRRRDVEHLGIAVVGRRGADEDARLRARRGCEGGMPASSSASQVSSSSSRCCGSICSASRGDMPKAGGIEAPDVVEHARRPGVAAPALALAGMSEPLQRPAVGRHLR